MKIKKEGDFVWIDGYTSFAQQNSQEKHKIEKVEYKFDNDSGEKFAIYYVNGNWYDSRVGSAYGNDNSMYFIEF